MPVPTEGPVPVEVPPGWSYNPSEWSERLPIVALASVGFGIATYLTLYQMGLVGAVWKPFFEDGSLVILNSKVSRLFPIPDGALGLLAIYWTQSPASSETRFDTGRCPGWSSSLAWRWVRSELAASSS